MQDQNNQSENDGTVHNQAPTEQATGQSQTSSTQQDENFRTPIEQAVDVARDGAGAAAGALRRGEFMHEPTIDPNATSDDRLIALLSYISQVFVPVIMPIIVLLSESSKKRPFQRYHAVQALALTITFMVVGLAAMVGVMIVQIVPIIGMLIGLAVLCMTPVAFVMYFIAMVYYGYQSYQGKRFAIPGLTAFLRDQGWLPD